MALAIIFSIGVLVISITSFSFIPSMKKNIYLTKCGIYVGLDTALNGDGNWGGFISLRNQIGNISSLLSSAQTKIDTYFTGDEWLIDDMTIMKT
jgi:hypothetical protein